MVSLGEGSLGSFQLGLNPTVAELSPLLTSSTIQGDSITRQIEDSGLILSNTFESPLFDGTQNIARSGDIVARNVSVFLEGLVSRTFDGQTVLSQTVKKGDQFTVTKDGDVVGTASIVEFNDTQKTGSAGDTLSVTAELQDVETQNLVNVVGGTVEIFNSPLFNGTQNLARSGSIVLASVSSLDTRTKIAVAANTVLRELSRNKGPNIGENQLGSFQLGADEIGNGEVFQAFADTKASAGNIFRPRVINVGRGVSRKFVTGEMPLTTSIQILEESISRTIDGDVLSLTVDNFLSKVFAKAVAGDTIQLTAQIIEATRLLTEWALGQRQLGRTLEEVREWEAMEIVYRYEKNQSKVDSSDFYTVHEATNNLKTKTEKVTVKELIDGGFKSVDLSGGDGLRNIQSPDTRRDVRPIDNWYVESIEQENIGKDGNSYDVTLDLVPDKNKAFDNEYGTFDDGPTVNANDNEWKFTFEDGEIATANVSINTSEDSEGTLDIHTLETFLKPEEVRVVEENISHLNLTKFRIVPDGEDVLDDASFDERNTVNIETPFDNNDPIPEGDYVFSAWDTEWLEGGVYRVEWEVVEK